MTRRKDDELVDVTELVLQPTEGKVRKPRKQLTHAEKVAQMQASKSMSMRLLGAWCTQYEHTRNTVKRWGFPYSLHAQTRDLAILKKMGEDWGEDETLAVMRAFFATTDPRIMRTNYEMTDFRFHAARLRMAQAGGEMHDKTASNIHEISKAMGRKA